MPCTINSASAKKPDLPSALRSAPLALLLVLTAGCFTPRVQKPEPAPAPNYTAYLYSLYETDWTARPSESLKEDRLELKAPATLVALTLGELAPRQALLAQLRAATNFFQRVEGIPAVLDVPAGAASPARGPATPAAVKEHLLKMRQLAADVGADYLYLLGTTTRTFVIQEPTGVLDLTILGYFLLGTNRIEVEGRGAAALVDVPSGRVLAVVTAERRFQWRVSSYSVQNNKHHAPARAIAQLEELLTRQLLDQLQQRQVGGTATTLSPPQRSAAGF